MQTFLPAGIFAYYTPLETARFFCDSKDVCGAIVDGVPHLSLAENLVFELRCAYPELPILLIVPQQGLPNASAEIAYYREQDPHGLMVCCMDFVRDQVGWGRSLSTYTLSIQKDSTDALLLGYPLHLSPRESAILRCLFAFAPKVVTADDLLLLCFPEGTQLVANLSVHISHINRRAAEIGLSPLIVSEYGKGYRLNRAVIC